MTRGRGGVTIPPKNDDVIYEQPLTWKYNAMQSRQGNAGKYNAVEYNATQCSLLDSRQGNAGNTGKYNTNAVYKTPGRGRQFTIQGNTIQCSLPD